LVTVAAWLLANPPPATLAQIDGGADGPFRSTDAPLAFRALGRRRLAPVAPPRAIQALVPLVEPAQPAWRTWRTFGVVGALAFGGASIAAHSIGYCVTAIGALGGLAVEWFDDRDRRAARAALMKPRPVVEELHLSPDDVQLRGAAPLRIALVDIIAFARPRKGDALRIQPRGEHGDERPILWVGPAAERRWIEALVQVAIDAARATAPASP
jgi:hypothetical protein